MILDPVRNFRAKKIEGQICDREVILAVKTGEKKTVYKFSMKMVRYFDTLTL